MQNQHGSFIWYELLTSDPDAAANFYGKVVGWNARSAGQPGVDYRLFAANGSDVAGHMKLPEEAKAAGSRPQWLGYIGVDDVDAAVASVMAAGGTTFMPAMDMEGVGRMAMLADPQGAPFYVMRGASDEPSNSFSPDAAGHCRWNELQTSDPHAALTFYTALASWEKGDAMPMGETGDYQFINQGGGMIGAVMPKPPQAGRPQWFFYFGVEDIDAAAAEISENGGTVHDGPMEIPGGEYAVVADDPQGARFGVVGPRVK